MISPSAKQKHGDNSNSSNINNNSSNIYNNSINNSNSSSIHNNSNNSSNINNNSNSNNNSNRRATTHHNNRLQSQEFATAAGSLDISLITSTSLTALSSLPVYNERKFPK